MQCQRLSNAGQCGHPAMPGSKFCRKHTRADQEIISYRINDPDLLNSVQHHARGSLADLTQQVVLLRGLIERRLNMADSEAEKIVAYNFVATQLATLTKMTESMVKLQREAGDLLEKSQVEEFVDRVVQVVSEELSDLPNSEEIVDKIVSRLEENSSE